MNKWFLVVAMAVAAFTVNAQESVSVEQQKNDSVELDFSDDGIRDFMESTDLIVSAMSPRLDVLQNEDGSLAYMFRREGCYLSLRGGFEYRALSSGLHYPGYMVQLGVGYFALMPESLTQNTGCCLIKMVIIFLPVCRSKLCMTSCRSVLLRRTT